MSRLSAADSQILTSATRLQAESLISQRNGHTPRYFADEAATLTFEIIRNF